MRYAGEGEFVIASRNLLFQAAARLAGQRRSGQGKIVVKYRMGMTRVESERPGDRIGRYKLLQQIGEGGCGVAAEQEEPLRRRVALKVIKLAMDTKQVVGRFEAERQSLALMGHPNIAKVLDAKVTDASRPYFVMELVWGVRITDYCDQNHLTLKDLLQDLGTLRVIVRYARRSLQSAS
jgi:hypothetical protein